MTAYEFVKNLREYSPEYETWMGINAAQQDLDTFRAEGWDVPEDMTAEEFASIWNEMIRESSTKTISLDGKEYEVSRVFFFFRDEDKMQEGVMLHCCSDENSTDVLYGNMWTVYNIDYPEDLESLLTSGDGTTYYTKNADGTYHVDA